MDEEYEISVRIKTKGDDMTVDIVGAFGREDTYAAQLATRALNAIGGKMAEDGAETITEH